MLTPEERRGALIVLALVLIGSAWEAFRAGRPAPPLEPPRAVAGADARPDMAAAASPGRPAADSAGSAPAAEPPISLNRATAAELEALPGIGPVLALRIVEHRRRAGAFRSVEELRAVRGVGPRLLARLRGRVEP